MKTELKEVIHIYLGCKMTDGRILHSVDIDGEWMLLAPNGGGCTNFRPEWDESVKPILHRLEDMTEEHYKELGYSPIIEISGLYYVKNLLQQKLIMEGFSVEEFLFLLKNGYDIFGLIDSNQAIDAKTLNQQ